MAIIANLAVAVTARTEKFNRKMTAAQKRTKMFGKAVTVVGIAAVTAFAGMLRVVASFGDGIAKMARRTGLGVKAVSELGYVAEISGSSMDAVEKGIKRMARTIVDADAGLATYTRAFERIGLKAEDLINLAPEKAFLTIADAISEVESPLLRSAAAQEIFGKAGTQLLPMFDLTGQEMEKLIERADKLGIVLTEDMAKDAEELQDAFTDLKKAGIGVVITGFELMGVETENLSESIANVTEQVRAFMKESAWLIDPLKFIAKWGLKASLQVTGLGAALKYGNKLFGDTADTLKVLEDAAEKPGKTLKEMAPPIAAAADEMGKFADDIAEVGRALWDLPTLQGLQVPSEPKLPAALEKGTTGAYSAIVQAKYGAQERAVEQTAANTAQANTKLDEVKWLLREIAGKEPELVAIRW